MYDLSENRLRPIPMDYHGLPSFLHESGHLGVYAVYPILRNTTIKKRLTIHPSTKRKLLMERHTAAAGPS
jgi:hypothetical protein